MRLETKIAKLVSNYNFTMVYARQITIVGWGYNGYKPTYNVWGAHIVGADVDSENPITFPMHTKHTYIHVYIYIYVYTYVHTLYDTFIV